MRADTADPVLPFNLGNVFQAQGRATEAKVAWQIAVARDPAFAEAWYNLAQAAEDEQQADLAIAQYRRAVQAQPDYADAHFNLALLLTRLERCGEALPAWERFLELEPASRAGRHGAEGDRAVPHEDPAGARAGWVRRFARFSEVLKAFLGLRHPLTVGRREGPVCEGRSAAITPLGGRRESLLVETAISYVRETTMNWAVLSHQHAKRDHLTVVSLQ